MALHPFSPDGRQAALNAMGSGRVDLLVIGGGITGCGLARHAALQGMTVALVEQEDFAAGTSSRSSKLIHGGLRYLEHFEVGMVRESARERQVLRYIAPHLVHPLRFIFPIWPGKSMAKYRLGLWLFDLLAAAEGEERHCSLSARDVEARLPGLLRPVTGGLGYGEYMTDDARFTLENALSAAQHGALVANHAPVRSLLYTRTGGGRKLVGAAVEDMLTGRTFEVQARAVVNATGPWATETLKLGGVEAPKSVFPSKGVHLLFRADRLPVTGAAVLNAPSGRAGFAIRRWDYVYVGTTDEVYHGPLDQPAATEKDVAELMALVRECFPGLELTEKDIVGTWAGLRPLIAEPGKTPRDTSRHDEVWESPEGLITIAGGKLTTYRPMARRVMEHVHKALGRAPGSQGDRTANVPLPGAPSPGSAVPVAAAGLTVAAAERLSWLYGARMAELVRMGEEDPTWLEPLAPGLPALRAEVRLAVTQEMAGSLADVLDRRTALLLFSPDHGLSAAEPTARIMADLLGWNEEERLGQLAAYAAFAAKHRATAI